MSRIVLNLSDDHWFFGQVPRCPFDAPNIYDLPAVAEWLPATVPGHVRTDLLALDRISNPFFGEGYKDSLWVEAVDWWYRRQIDIDPLTPPQRAFLIFDGIDYRSAIFVNGRELARHEGMFSRQIIEITDALHQPDPAELAVRLWGSTALPKRRLSRLQRLWQRIAAPLHGSWVGIYPDRSATLKCQMSFGWDFAPPIRTMGIWDEVRLVITGLVAIIEASAVGQPIFAPYPIETKSEAGQSPPLRGGFRGGGSTPTTLPADLTLHLTLDADRPHQVEATVQLSPANFDGATPPPFNFSLNTPAGRTTHRLQSHLPEVALWQPWDCGQPNLYNVHLILTDPAGQPFDDLTFRTGFRTVELEQWQVRLNGRPEFIRGLNWVPADSFPGRLRRNDYARLLKMARQSGANLLRVWGGGLREKRAFYDLCDELGLLVWQEFPFACMFLGSYPRDPAYLALVEVECGSIIRQVRHHPSVILWCGGNEFSRRRNRPLLDTLAAVVDLEDCTRPFIPVSPSFDHGRDAHNWHVWHGQAPIRSYRQETAHFLSEFGLQALPHPDTLRAALPDPTTNWESHHADLPKLERYISSFNQQFILNNEQLSVSNLPFAIHNSQSAQAIALQTAIEHMRRRKGEVGGVCLWQFNEPWPAITWAIVDYFGRPKLAYDRLADWYNLVLISLNFPPGRRWQPGDLFKADIWAVNDSRQAYAGCALQIALDDELVHTHSLDLLADSACPINSFTHRLTASPRQLSLTLHHGGELLAQNRYDLAWSDESGPGLFPRLRRRLADWVLR